MDNGPANYKHSRDTNEKHRGLALSPLHRRACINLSVAQYRKIEHVNNSLYGLNDSFTHTSAEIIACNPTLGVIPPLLNAACSTTDGKYVFTNALVSSYPLDPLGAK